MKAIIDGKRYDTTKATLIGEYYTPGIDKNDFGYWEAALYKTPRSGRFFIAGEGHANTSFASHYGDTRGWGERRIPMDKQEALCWAEAHLEPEAIEEHFSDMIEDA